MRSILLVLMFLAVLNPGGFSQEFKWNAGFDGLLDNREYFSIDNPQTIFGSRTWAELGASLGSGHSLMAGINYLYEFGGEVNSRWPDLSLYYHYENEHVDFYMGAFPRRALLNFPIAMLSDTLLYYRPHIEGVYFGYEGSWGEQNVFIDWTSRQTDTAPEQFIFGTSGVVRHGIFFLDNYIMMSHLAGRGIPLPGDHLRDNGGANLNLGLDLSAVLPLDSLSLSAGVLQSFDRTRGVDDGWQTPTGFLGQLEAQYRIAGVSALYYRGQGHPFVYGDPFYLLEEYGRLDLYLAPFRSRKVSLKINFVLHFALGQVDYSQQLLLSVRMQ